MARPGSPNPDYNENLFPDERSRGMYTGHLPHHEALSRQQQKEGLFHDRREEGRRHTPMARVPDTDTPAKAWSKQTGKPYWHRDSPMWSSEARRGFAEDDLHDREAEGGDWGDKMIRAQDAEEGYIEPEGKIARRVPLVPKGRRSG